MESNKVIYAVYATDTDRDRLLGYATGNTVDIEAYFDSRKGYGLEINPITICHVPPGYSSQHRELIAKRADLERQINELNKQIGT
jgi:hypothetical protein